MKTADSYPNFKEGTDGLVVTCLQVHVTLVFELLDTVSPPEDSVTPSRDTTLSTAGIHHQFSSQLQLRGVNSTLMSAHQSNR